MNLREKEIVLMEIQPHPIAFMDLYIIFLVPILINIYLIFKANYIVGSILQILNVELLSEDQMKMIIWTLMNIFPFIIMFLVKSAVKWLLIGSLMIIVAIIIKIQYGVSCEILGIIFGIIGLGLTNIYRKAHKYYITNERIVMEFKFIRHKHREIELRDIRELIVEKGIIGRILDVGTILPITSSGLGIGEDISMIGGAGKIKNINIGIGAGRTIKVPRGRSPYTLFGVKKPLKIKELISKEKSKHEEDHILTEISNKLERIIGDEEKETATLHEKRIEDSGREGLNRFQL
ncbi:MAG: hypothetical protein DRJ30_02105 [Candidatus Methanomethylicota archaeon]|nr:MAG: hypothetical protein DRJ30_02105 [Candidatus Verstraetearchaeota archaeon]